MDSLHSQTGLKYHLSCKEYGMVQYIISGVAHINISVVWMFPYSSQIEQYETFYPVRGT